ncbi:hypothetical protein HDU96_006296 [Phlyctochytrium bullatum]|nr:hypothetical protein HDU96_006296 [Phlyctochytrium bullatum]
MNSPIPSDVASECKKCAKIINQFIKPTSKGLDQIIPPDIIAQAKGIAILSVVKAGFLFSGRGGAGLVVARLEDGSWSAPSAIGTAGFGAGGQIGIEVTDFVIILNTMEAVRAFSLGGNNKVAAGPVGRNAEAAGTLGKLSAIYSYSKTRGLFVGVSIEGSVIVERKETNAAFYRRKVSAKEILSGQVPPPPAAEELYRALNRRSSLPDEDDHHSSTSHLDRRTSNASTYSSSQWPDNRRPSLNSDMGRSDTYGGYSSSSAPPRPSIPSRPPPPRPFDNTEKAVALYDFSGEREGDLPFRKGDLILILKRDPSEWWTGRCNGKEGVFPANYVQVS